MTQRYLKLYVKSLVYFQTTGHGARRGSAVPLPSPPRSNTSSRVVIVMLVVRMVLPPGSSRGPENNAGVKCSGEVH
jgi:hypothetical protein